MDSTDAPATPPRPTALQGLARAAQWVVFLILVIMIIGPALALRKLDVPGAPVNFVYAALAVAVTVAILHLPPVFFRLPIKARWLGYAAIVGSIALSNESSARMKWVWIKTWRGEREFEQEGRDKQARAKEQAERDKTERLLTENKAATERLLEQAAASKADVERYAEKIESCFSTFGHRLPAFEERMKSSVHNPDAFEHVETIAIVPDSAGYNVAMTFRAENGFGAIRTATVKAKVVADGCELTEIGDTQVND